MQPTLRGINVLLWGFIWLSGALVTDYIPYEGLFDARLYADSGRFIGQGFFFLTLMIANDFILVWLHRQQTRRCAL